MKIGNTDVKISILAVAVVAVFAILLIIAYTSSGDTLLLAYGIPMLVAMFAIPIALNYMSQRQYEDLLPTYERDARPVRIKMINEKMMGQPVRIEAVVERRYFQFLNRPQYLVGDRTGEISVKMFTNPKETVQKGDVVEVLGMIIHRYVIGGDPVINAVSIRKIDKKIETKKDPKKD